MGPIAFFKSDPAEHVLVYKQGKVIREGSGLALVYWRPTTSIMLIPTSTLDAPFIFNELTSDFQAVTVQGQVTYRISDPRKIATLLNFTVDGKTKEYLSEDPDRLSQRVINIVQEHMRSELSQRALEKMLRDAELIANRAMITIRESNILREMGVECVRIFIASIKPIPEVAKALEAEYREALQRRADEAIYARRAAAVEQERKIKENELDTQVALEQQRKKLVELQGENARKAAEYDAQAIKTRFSAYQQVDPKTLFAIAFKEFAENADKIENLMITPELLSSIMGGKGIDSSHGRA